MQVSVALQEVQTDGCLLSACVNAACLALLDASVPLRHMLAAVTVVVGEGGQLVCDPTAAQEEAAAATATFIFSNRGAEAGAQPGLVSSHTVGRLSPAKLQECCAAATTASQAVLQFYRDTIARKFSKEAG